MNYKTKRLKEFRKESEEFIDKGGLLSRERDVIGYDKKKLEQFILKTIDQVQAETKREIAEKIEKVKAPRMTEETFEDVPNKRGIWYAGFSECKRRIIKKIIKL